MKLLHETKNMKQTARLFTRSDSMDTFTVTHVTLFVFSVTLGSIMNLSLNPSLSCAQPQTAPSAQDDPASIPIIPSSQLESADAQWFIAQVNRGLRAVWVASSEAAWRNATDITPEHERALAERSAARPGKSKVSTKATGRR